MMRFLIYPVVLSIKITRLAQNPGALAANKITYYCH